MGGVVQPAPSHKYGIVVEPELAVEVHGHRHRCIIRSEAEAVVAGLDCCLKNRSRVVAAADSAGYNESSGRVETGPAPASGRSRPAELLPVVSLWDVLVALSVKRVSKSVQ